MGPAIVLCTLSIILTSSLLENAGAQTRNPHDSWTVVKSLETLSETVKNLQTEIQRQAVVLNSLVTKEELESILLKNFLTKSDTQLLETTLLNNLASKEEWQQPIPLYTTNRTIGALEGDDVEIWCVVRGTPLSEIKWTRENGTLTSDRVEYGNNGKALRIKKVRLSDRGTYVCVAANGVGSPVSQSVSLEVQGPTGLFAATTTGLVSLDLETLEATALTSENILAVAVNHKLKKVYWSEFTYRIMRSNFDGSSKEVIVPQTGDYINMLTIDEPSGNVHFARYSSNQITVCNALGQNCTEVISNSQLVNHPIGFALDSDNGVMYWGGDGSPNYLVRANLDGSNATIISTTFRVLFGITSDQRSKGVLYWTDWLENTVGTIDVNGGNKRTLVKLKGNPGPWGIQVDAHKIYFSNYSGKNIQSVHKDSGRELTTIFNSTGNVRQLALFNAPA